MIAAGVVETFGYRSVLCQQAGFDMLVMRDDDRHYRCEVKTRSVATTDANRNSDILRYSWTTANGCDTKTRLKPEGVDLLILVALDIRRCYFIPVFEHKVVRKNIRKDLVLAIDEKAQLDGALARIDERKNYVASSD